MRDDTQAPARDRNTAGGAGGFDPVQNLLVAQSSRPPHVRDVNLRTVTPYQRALLVIDGTVTKFVEAYTMEPVDVVRLSQTTRHLPADHPWLEAPEGTEVTARQVLLQGRYSYTLHAHATSLLVLDRLQAAVKRDLLADGDGLGRVLLKSRLETRREILWYGQESREDLPESLRALSDSEFLSRTYRIIADGSPIVLINEQFPTGIDRLPAHH